MIITPSTAYAAIPELDELCAETLENEKLLPIDYFCEIIQEYENRLTELEIIHEIVEPVISEVIIPEPSIIIELYPTGDCDVFCIVDRVNTLETVMEDSVLENRTVANYIEFYTSMRDRLYDIKDMINTCDYLQTQTLLDELESDWITISNAYGINS